MNTSTATVGFMLSFLAGAGLTWGVAKHGDSEASRSSAPVSEPARQASSPIPVGPDDPAWGSPEAPVSVVVISDFECPYCARVTSTLARVEKEYGPERVRVVWKHNPLPSHPGARPAAEAAAAVHALGGDFWKFHDLAFSHQRELSGDNFTRWAAEAGVDAGRLAAELKTERASAKVERDMALARQIGARSTPHFRINGKALIGAQPFEQFKRLIDEQLAAAEALAKTGVRRADLSLQLTKTNFRAAPPPEKPKAPEAPPIDTRVWKVPVSADDPVQGPADALVTIVEFSDFQCPYCSKVGPTLERLREEYPKDVRVVWKDFPLSFHPRAKPAAILARFAYDQHGNDGFWKAHDALFESQKNLEDESLVRIAEALGLDGQRARAALASGRYDEKLSQSAGLGGDFAVPSTPHFFVNGRRLSGARPYEDFKRLVDEQLGVAQALLNKGVRRADVFRELMKSAQAAPEPERKTVAAPTRANPWRGPEKARVTITEFSDFQCPFCSRVTETIEQLLAAYPKDVKLVWRHQPLSFHPNAALAAEAAQEAFEQAGNDGFWKYHDTLFANQKALARPDLERYAREQGLDMARFNAALDSRKHEPHVDRDSEEALRAGIAATPGFVINGYFMSGAQPFDKFDRLVQRALKAD
jgi:protein-disulfide isomerase